MGRAHHRVLHFVNRNPGLRVADLLEILKITKQSLARVLKQLVDEGWIAQKAGERRPPPAAAVCDRKRAPARRPPRQPAGQAGRAALAQAGAGSETSMRRFLFSMIAKEERALVEALLPGRSRPPRQVAS